MKKMIDLFDFPDLTPAPVRELFDEIDRDLNYDQLADLKNKVEALGYTFDYYLDGQPSMLRPKSEIDQVLLEIERQTGMKLEKCEHFTGLKFHKERPYFNVKLKRRVSESMEYLVLEQYANKTKSIDVEPNGHSRAAIYINTI